MNRDDPNYLTFPTLVFGKHETPWTLLPLLFKGGAATNPPDFAALRSAGRLGKPIEDRRQVIEKIHEFINAKLVGGGSMLTAESQIGIVRRFVTWAERSNLDLSLSAIQSIYLRWGDHLQRRSKVLKEIKETTAYRNAKLMGAVLDSVLERGAPLLGMTRLRKVDPRRTARGIEAEKQNLEETFQFGRFLQDICDALPLDATWGPLPVRIALRGGWTLEEWSGLIPLERLKTRKRDTRHRRYLVKASDAARGKHEADRTLATRFPIVNLRIEAELLMFIGQTGMNLAGAQNAKLRDFYFSSDINGWKVHDRKERRGGDVLFEIFLEYRSHFERYLAWRRAVFPPEEELLFPMVRPGGRRIERKLKFNRLRSSCGKLNLRFIPPSELRNTRVNWLLRRSGDGDVTAEMDQHTKEVLHRTYERPSLQRAMTETMRFWSKADPIQARTQPAAPGECNGQPSALPFAPRGATQPDCIHPSGCLWCVHHRDVDTLDYVLSITSFRHLKTVEVSKLRVQRGKDDEQHPARLSIERLSQKLKWFMDSNARRRGWVEEALACVEEGRYHPDWERLIVNAEGGDAL